MQSGNRITLQQLPVMYDISDNGMQTTWVCCRLLGLLAFTHLHVSSTVQSTACAAKCESNAHGTCMSFHLWYSLFYVNLSCETWVTGIISWLFNTFYNAMSQVIGGGGGGYSVGITLLLLTYNTYMFHHWLRLLSDLTDTRITSSVYVCVEEPSCM